jgi:putative Mn2+ efflux pump MntP
MMNVFKKAEMQWWEIGLIKIALLIVGIAIGASWPEFFERYAPALFAVGVIFGFCAFCLWAKK